MFGSVGVEEGLSLGNLTPLSFFNFRYKEVEINI